jgi:HEPN domain-containing protein
MTGYQDAEYRLKVAHGFLEEGRQDVVLRRWRSAVDNAQLAVENAGKAVLGLVGPIGRTHNPAVQLRKALEDDLFIATQRERVRKLAEKAEMLGHDIHVQTDYGDEVGGKTPWELFDENDAHQSLSLAEEAVALADAVIRSAEIAPSRGEETDDPKETEDIVK